MGNITLIYDDIINNLGTEYDKITCQYMDEDSKDTVGIYLYESSSDLNDFNNNLIYSNVKCQIQVQVDKTEEDINKALNYLNEFIDKYKYSKSKVKEFNKIHVSVIGSKSIALGVNKYGFMVCKSTINIKYRII